MFDHISPKFAPIADHKYRGCEYDKTEGTPQKYEVLKKTANDFQAKYTGPSHEYGYAVVDLYAEKRLLPDIKNKDNLANDKIAEMNREIDASNHTIQALTNQQSALMANLGKIFESEAEQAKVLIKQNELIIAEKTEQMNAYLVPRQKQLINELNQAKEILEADKAKYEMVHRLHTYTPFQEEVVQEFINAYENCYPNKKEERQHYVQHNTRTVNPAGFWLAVRPEAQPPQQQSYQFEAGPGLH